MPGADRKLQKKLEKARKKREGLKKEARKIEAKYQGASLLRLATSAPFGPCWVSRSLDEADEDGVPSLVTVLVTRRIRGQLLGQVVLVDRTCLGVKNANLLPCWPEQDVREYVTDALRHVGELRECDAHEAQSVVFHALDYAGSLGFSAHADFELALFEPRPETLRETPFARPERPMYATGPNDNVGAILQRLERAVGAGNYDFFDGPTFDLLEDEDEGEEFDDDDMIETTGESA